MYSQKLSHKDYQLEYFVYGTGPRTLIAFHGFNNNAHDFAPLAKIAGDEYTIVAINIFFHGNSTVEEHLIEKGFTDEDLKTLFEDICNIHRTEKYSLMGYSLGGRIVLKIFELFPQKIDQLILLAPDGIKVNPFYKFFTRTTVGKKMLRHAVYKPRLFHNVAGLLRKTRIVSEKRFQFAYSNFESETKRKQVYSVWMTLRNVLSDMKVIKKLISENQVMMHLFFGKYDKIIPVSIGESFRKGVENKVKLHILDEGHRLVKPEVLLKVMKLSEKGD